MQKQIGLGLTAVVLLGVAGYMLFGASDAVELPDAITTLCIDLATGEDVAITHTLDERPPFESATGEMSVYPWYYSYASEKLFVPRLVRDQARGVMTVDPYPQCPETNSGSVSPYSPDDPTQVVKGRIDPPQWPLRP